jgi:hypothetical protein
MFPVRTLAFTADPTAAGSVTLEATSTIQRQVQPVEPVVLAEFGNVYLSPDRTCISTTRRTRERAALSYKDAG